VSDLLEIRQTEWLAIETPGDVQVVELPVETIELLEIPEQGPAGPPGPAGPYLGAKSADPLTDNEGNPLADGDLYFNTIESRMRIYASGAWNEGYDHVTAALDGGAASAVYLAAQNHDGGLAGG